MPRTMNPDSTGVVRALVDKLTRPDRFGYVTESKIVTRAYGPYADSTSCRDMEPNGLPTRVRKQKLEPYVYGPMNARSVDLEWVTIKTTYTNGGEDVNWDERAGV